MVHAGGMAPSARARLPAGDDAVRQVDQGLLYADRRPAGTGAMLAYAAIQRLDAGIHLPVDRIVDRSMQFVVCSRAQPSRSKSAACDARTRCAQNGHGSCWISSQLVAARARQREAAPRSRVAERTKQHVVGRFDRWGSMKPDFLRISTAGTVSELLRTARCIRQTARWVTALRFD